MSTTTDAQTSVETLFRYSAYVHVGAGAQECAHATDGACKNMDHFHAWIRIPNSIQQESIREHALAAKARRMRQLRDPESDSHVILEGDMAELREVPHSELVDEIVAKDFSRDHMETLRDLSEDERFEHIDRDIERRDVLQKLDEDKRPKDEWEELTRHITTYREALREGRDERQKPRREALKDRSADDLLEIIREERVKREAQVAYNGSFSKWQWLAGTLKPVSKGRPNEPMYREMAQIEREAPEILEGLDAAFSDLEAAFGRGLTGNS
jgi:hypothetical protein